MNSVYNSFVTVVLRFYGVDITHSILYTSLSRIKAIIIYVYFHSQQLLVRITNTARITSSRGHNNSIHKKYETLGFLHNNGGYVVQICVFCWLTSTALLYYNLYRVLLIDASNYKVKSDFQILTR